jgi:hypothetical protein
MKWLLSLLVLAGAASLGMTGCAKEESAKTETKTSTEGGTTTVTEEVTVEKTGDNPPPAN